MRPNIVTQAIETSLLNRGLTGADWLSEPKNVPVVFEDEGVILFDYLEDGIYEAHLLLKARGRQAKSQGEQALKVIFEEKNACFVYGITPDDIPAAKLYVRRLGFKSLGPLSHPEGPCEKFILGRNEWRRRQSNELSE